MSCDFPKWLSARTGLDGAGDALREKKPPWDDIAVPSVNDGLDWLVEQVAIGEVDLHRGFRVDDNLPYCHRDSGPQWFEVWIVERGRP